MTPFFGSMASVALVFIINRGSLAEQTALAYENSNLRELHRFLSHKWYFDTVYNRCINQPLLFGAYRVVFALIDKGLLEIAGPTGMGAASFHVGRTVTTAQTGRVYDYA
jgi:NADH:ubiquinone oxidoreductase subunit 5 (subunit L)/multisubunit Na+/H+ antiporter MnhA subunit